MRIVIVIILFALVVLPCATILEVPPWKVWSNTLQSRVLGYAQPSRRPFLYRKIHRLCQGVTPKAEGFEPAANETSEPVSKALGPTPQELELLRRIRAKAIVAEPDFSSSPYFALELASGAKINFIPSPPTPSDRLVGPGGIRRMHRGRLIQSHRGREIQSPPETLLEDQRLFLERSAKGSEFAAKSRGRYTLEGPGLGFKKRGRYIRSAPLPPGSKPMSKKGRSPQEERVVAAFVSAPADQQLDFLLFLAKARAMNSTVHLEWPEMEDSFALWHRLWLEELTYWGREQMLWENWARDIQRARIPDWIREARPRTGATAKAARRTAVQAEAAIRTKQGSYGLQKVWIAAAEAWEKASAASSEPGAAEAIPAAARLTGIAVQATAANAFSRGNETNTTLKVWGKGEIQAYFWNDTARDLERAEKTLVRNNRTPPSMKARGYGWGPLWQTWKEDKAFIQWNSSRQKSRYQQIWTFEDLKQEEIRQGIQSDLQEHSNWRAAVDPWKNSIEELSKGSEHFASLTAQNFLDLIFKLLVVLMVSFSGAGVTFGVLRSYRVAPTLGHGVT